MVNTFLITFDTPLLARPRGENNHTDKLLVFLPQVPDEAADDPPLAPLFLYKQYSYTVLSRTSTLAKHCGQISYESSFFFSLLFLWRIFFNVRLAIDQVGVSGVASHSRLMIYGLNTTTTDLRLLPPASHGTTHPTHMKYVLQQSPTRQQDT